VGAEEGPWTSFYVPLRDFFYFTHCARNLDLHVDTLGQLDLLSFSLLPVAQNIDYRLDLTHVPSYCAKKNLSMTTILRLTLYFFFLKEVNQKT
jgi:hypothetical protein